MRKKADGTPAVYHFNQQQILTLAQLRLAMGDNDGARSLAGAVLEWSEREAANYRKDQWENERAGDSPCSAEMKKPWPLLSARLRADTEAIGGTRWSENRHLIGCEAKHAFRRS